VRAPQPDDLKAVFELVSARNLADRGVVDYALDDLRDQWGRPDFDLSADARVVVVDGQIAGYASVIHAGGEVSVSPEHEGRGIGTRLRQFVEVRELALGRPLHIQTVARGNERAAALMLAAGYHHTRSYARMIRLLSGSAAEPVIPDGVSLRPLDRDADAIAVHALDDAAFCEAPDYIPESLEIFRREHLGTHDYDPFGSMVACRGDEVVGFLLGKRWEQESSGFVSIVAVQPGGQAKGVGTALLTAAFVVWTAAGLGSVQLGVASDNPRARALYERLGMTERFQVDFYERATGLAVATSS
jgi:mycothiol synthase